MEEEDVETREGTTGEREGHEIEKEGEEDWILEDDEKEDGENGKVDAEV